MKFLRVIYISLFFALLLCMGLGPVLFPYQGLLFSENRETKSLKEVTAKDLVQGDFFTKLNDILQDTHPLRQDLISWKAGFQGKVLGRPVVNNVYWKGDTLLAYVNGIQTDTIVPDESLEDMGNFYGKLAKFCEKEGSHFVFIGLPNHTQAFAKDYPFYMESTSFLGALEKDFQGELEKKNVDSLFLSPLLLKNPSAYYLRTDHHLQAQGALLASQKILEKLDPKRDYNLEKDYKICRDLRPFVGSRSRKIPGLGPEEKLYYPRYQKPFSYSYQVDGGEGKILDLQDQKSTVDYGVYMEGDVGYGQLKTDNEKGLKLLIYGDSYTNALETVLAPYCGKLTSFDFRYGNPEDFMEEVKSGDYDYVLCVRDSSMYLKKSPNGRFF